jgi:uncharacterized protein (TIGR02246 family)
MSATRFFIAACALVLLGLPSFAQTPAADEAAIRELVKRYSDARNANDAKTLESLFVADADQLVSSGEWRRGRDAVVKGSLASSAASSGQRTFTIETVRLLAPTVAIVDSRYEIGGSNGAAPRSMWAAWLIVKTGDGWRIGGIRNMLPAPAPAAR